jgi:hypothetical protein
LEKFGYKNAIKHEKGGTPRFSDNLKCPSQNNLVKRLSPPSPGICNYFGKTQEGKGGRESNISGGAAIAIERNS